MRIEIRRLQFHFKDIQFRKNITIKDNILFMQGESNSEKIYRSKSENRVAVACTYEDGGITGIMFCHQTGGPISAS